MGAQTSEDGITVDEFRHAFRHHPAGVAVVTAEDENGPVAMTVSSLSSIAIEPPTLVFSASGMSSSTNAIRNAKTVVIHLLSSEDVELAKLASTSGVDRFGGSVKWNRLPTGEPHYSGATSWLRGRILNRLDVSGSTLVVVEAVEAKRSLDHSSDSPRPLVYHNRNWHVLSEDSKIKNNEM